jgi:hypothetical protein
MLNAFLPIDRHHLAMGQKKFYIYQLAADGNPRNEKMSMEGLADNLTKNGFRAANGNKYKAGAGLGNLVGYAFNFIENLLGRDKACQIYDFYVDRNGEPPSDVRNRKKAA